MDELKQLPSPEMDARMAERVRLRAQAVRAQEERLAARPWLAAGARAWRGVLEPAVVGGAVAAYLTWAVWFAGALYR